MAIRRARESDFSSLYAIYMEKSVNPYLGFEIMDEDAFRPIFKEMFLTGEILVLEEMGKVIASCTLVNRPRRNSHIVCVDTFVVDPLFKNKGYGTQLMQYAIDHCRQKEHIKRMELLTEVDNLVAIKLYEKLGFKIEGTLKLWQRRSENEYVDEYFMGLLL